MNHKSQDQCPACVTGRIGEVVAIKDANACNGSQCTCGCHALWAELRGRHVPIGKP